MSVNLSPVQRAQGVDFQQPAPWLHTSNKLCPELPEVAGQRTSSTQTIGIVNTG
jgi:hypothetical protein